MGFNKPSEKHSPRDIYLEPPKGIEKGQRCEVNPGGKRGTIAYIGPVTGLPDGYFIGVHYDQPVGKNDGR